MCLCYNLNRAKLLFYLRIWSQKNQIQPVFCFSKYFSEDDNKESVLDGFTSQLMRRKSVKWGIEKQLAQKKIKNNKIDLIPKVKAYSDRRNNQIDIGLLEVHDINYLFEQAVDYNDIAAITELTKQCIKYDKIPSLTILIHSLSLCSCNGYKDTVMEITKLCEKLRPEFVQENSHFEHYIAEAVWIKGNIVESLKMFEKVYRENIYLRRKIRCILQYLIQDVVVKHSEAILVNIIRFSEQILREYNDFYPLVCIWQQCFLSEWFTDQQLALELLEKHDGLCNAVLGRLPYVVRVSLNHHRIEVVYRLTEILLKYKMESDLVQVLLALIDYLVKKGDLKQCDEVIKWSIENNLPLPTVVQKTLLKVNKEFKSTTESSLPKRPLTDFKF